MSYLKFWLPILLVILITPWTPFLDLSISRYFYQLGDRQFLSNDFIKFAFTFGFYPANIVCILALLVLIISLFSAKFVKWRRAALVLILTLAVGAGLITHVALKDHWGRPRPKQVIEFGGKQEFRPYYKPNFFNQPEPSKSFSCGHCSTGFFFFALALIGRRLNNKKLSYLGWILAFGLGILLSVVRIAQGGHFFSDTLISALIMWETALFFDWLIYQNSVINFFKELN